MTELLEVQHTKRGAGSVVLMQPTDTRILLLIRWDKPYTDAQGRRRTSGWHWWRYPALSTSWT